MRNRMRAVRRSSTDEVAACDMHLPDAMRQVTSPVDGHDNDTHIVVRRLGDKSTVLCATQDMRTPHVADWVLIPQAVLR